MRPRRGPSTGLDRRRWARAAAGTALGLAAPWAAGVPVVEPAAAPRPAPPPPAPAPAPAPGPTTAFDFVAYGDMPYGDDLSQGPAYRHLIGLINAARPRFSVHVGDFKSGIAACGDDEFARQDAYFAQLAHPLIYTPGDNDWFDCRRRGQDPLERLQALRERFFAEPRSRGGQPRAVERQVDAAPVDSAGGADAPAGGLPENLRWSEGGVRFASFHTIGADNGFATGRDPLESEARDRDAANVAWIRDTFALATRERARALVFFTHGSPLVPRAGRPRGELWVRTTFARTISQTLVALAERDGRPVLLIHGDDHQYTADLPFRNPQGRRVANLARLQVFGDPRLHAVRVRVLTLPAPAPRVGPVRFQFHPIWNRMSPDPRLHGR